MLPTVFLVDIWSMLKLDASDAVTIDAADDDVVVGTIGPPPLWLWLWCPWLGGDEDEDRGESSGDEDEVCGDGVWQEPILITWPPLVDDDVGEIEILLLLGLNGEFITLLLLLLLCIPPLVANGPFVADDGGEEWWCPLEGDVWWFMIVAVWWLFSGKINTLDPLPLDDGGL